MKNKIIFTLIIIANFLANPIRLLSYRYIPPKSGLDRFCISHIHLVPPLLSSRLGKEIVQKLVGLPEGHRKIILYANPGVEGFYAKLGFKRMNTAMAIFQNEAEMLVNGTISEF